MIKRWQMLLVTLATVVPLLATASARADCVDINADPAERLTAIAHINDERAVQLISGGCPTPLLTRVAHPGLPASPALS